ncbi:Mg2+ and Co2+ transporter [Clostridium pasteurianum DSM 525 = ATCC 6013]|uniref:Mg2 transporter protein CorA family protein n=1 Tax=Clostridium pasteurianum DSM 525 = ATCC 6013 TaxID=1262449 RepID=A0A0H3J549_CLOPA|nr:magnesium transporter CorA family protein [Clostridium pasteurianum]AJA47098.1 Mg2+ and Co2+ transporter [Clostridium pasteurianum DSM 525 = ATCC 6013]AJA51086.1 Mg2+ and Co2+ transporter [Clostridium pasteurianum DSM 525 = ATCC 6013]AOZ74461.1 magnesium transporter CorA [Clostridium pasteurianum DSM 525 = ATCC 6013]AOZ78258.1 magnesium transporter CorA [Clostridium pasteurianum]ELP59513.1 Mg2 transporter protein CorA family protein [Clostridium pasteurianum DSM 525 = ATCC 6013]
MFKKHEAKKIVSNINLNTSTVREIKYKNLTWIDIERPTNVHMDMLKEKFDFHELLLEDCMTEHQRSKIDDYDEYCFIVLHMPRYKKMLEIIEPAEVDIFIGPNYLITLHEGELKPLMVFASLCDAKEEAKVEYMSEGSALLLYEIIKRLFDYCMPMLDKIGILLNKINVDIFKNTSKAMLKNISIAKMQIINFRRIVKPVRPVILSLEKIIVKYLPENMDIYFDDITDKAEKIWDMLENDKEVIESIDSTFTSLTNNKSNNLMTVFTIIQVVILPMTLVGGLFSMNVSGIPLHDYGNAFWIVFGMIMVPTSAIALAMVINRKKWF